MRAPDSRLRTSLGVKLQPTRRGPLQLMPITSPSRAASGSTRPHQVSKGMDSTRSPRPRSLLPSWRGARSTRREDFACRLPRGESGFRRHPGQARPRRFDGRLGRMPPLANRSDSWPPSLPFSNTHFVRSSQRKRSRARSRGTRLRISL